VPGEALISLRDIHLGFEDREVLAGISFDVGHGETKVLLGETGTGKTLIMKLAAGLIQPTSLCRKWQSLPRSILIMKLILATRSRKSPEKKLGSSSRARGS